MASRDSLEMRKLAAQGKAYQRGDDESKALRIRHTGSGASPSMVVTTASGLALTQGAATVSAPYQWAGTVTTATLGALCDAINASGLWEAKLLDGLRADTLVNYFKSNTTVTPGVDDNGVQVWDLVVDNNVSLTPTVCFSPFYNFDAPKGHKVQVQSTSYNENTGTEATSRWDIYKRLGNGTEVQIIGQLGLGTANTTYQQTWAAGFGFISGDENGDMIYRVTSDSITDNAANLVQITGMLE